jgi:hypothetical protein
MQARSEIHTSIIFVLTTSILLTGCRSPDVVRCCSSVPKPGRGHYVQLEETTLGLLADNIYERYRSRKRFIETLRQEFGKYDDLMEYLAACEALLDQFHIADQRFLDELKQSITGPCDRLLYYDLRNGNSQEQGWMVVHKGHIKKKIVLTPGEEK